VRAAEAYFAGLKLKVGRQKPIAALGTDARPKVPQQVSAGSTLHDYSARHETIRVHSIRSSGASLVTKRISRGELPMSKGRDQQSVEKSNPQVWHRPVAGVDAGH
jgi:hypothetical protein